MLEVFTELIRAIIKVATTNGVSETELLAKITAEPADIIKAQDAAEAAEEKDFSSRPIDKS
uniref:Uncharacterized protein n=1 Tax=viral metagenome TaxID=1070528 RepID=A0A6M3XW35_9ZZZZ